MSGGVDSSVAAFLLKAAGYDCVGATMRLFDNDDALIPREKGCCSLEDSEDARSVCYRLGIPHYVFNFTAEFNRDIIDAFAAAYARGATPNPCIDCNRYLKFGKLWHRAQELGCDFIASGHYARIERKNNRYLLQKAVDLEKDQSYVLYAMTQELLAHTLFPLGGMTKEETREIARQQGFLNAEKRESQDICFVPDGDYAKVIEGRRGEIFPPGDFIDPRGNVLGRHRGIIRYTRGQRHGLGIAGPVPLYVVDIDAETNRVTLGNAEELKRQELFAKDFNWIAFDAPPSSLRAAAKIRYRQQEQGAAVFPGEGGSARIVFDTPQQGITPGQAVVVYDGDTVIGGGTIC